MFESHGLNNLIKTYGITGTRTKLYDKNDTHEHYADYIFVSSDIDVTDFRVLPDEVSDHAPLLVDII
jgi:endonuclease/exonuclease/phosphatase family metal-dependent hydrolase